MRTPPALLILCLSAVAALAGCRPSAAPPAPPPTVWPAPPPAPAPDPQTLQVHAALYAGSEKRFRQGAFLSPDPRTVEGELRWMTPLIVQQFDPRTAVAGQWQRFGTLVAEPGGTLAVDLIQPTVYHAATTRTLHGTEYGQSTYVWFYPPAAVGGPIRWRGFHMLLGPRGYALVWEILSSDAGVRQLYVSKPIEQAAAAHWGRPLAFRRYCTEPDLAEYPDVIVVRAVGDGPQPMGPFLYLDHADLQVATLICRCEPSQVDEFPTSLNYRLAAWAELQGVAEAADLPPGWLPDPADSRMHLLRLASPPEGSARPRERRSPRRPSSRGGGSPRRPSSRGGGSPRRLFRPGVRSCHTGQTVRGGIQ